MNFYLYYNENTGKIMLRVDPMECSEEWVQQGHYSTMLEAVSAKLELMKAIQ
jgi:hypothetical protein